MKLTQAQRPRPAPIDWSLVITSLEHSGVMSRDIAAKLGRSKGWVIKLKNSPGAEPNYPDGEALLNLWCSALNKLWSDVPRL